MTSSLPTSATDVLAYIPSPPQGVWELGPFPLRAYAFFIIVGIIVAIFWGERRWLARGGEPGTVLDIAIWAVPFGLIGGRIYHVATDWPKYFGEGQSPIDALKIWQGGLGIWGAVFFGAIGAWLGCRQRGIPLGAFGDAIAPGILLAQAIGRIGNYFNQELYGRETDLPWGLEIYQRFNSLGERNDLNGVSIGVVEKVVHPTFLYELLWNVLIVGLLVVLDRRFKIGHGRLFALYVAGYCLGRFGVELMRADEASHIAGIRINSFTSAIVFVLAAAYFIFAEKGREEPEELLSRETREAAALEADAEADEVDEVDEDGAGLVEDTDDTEDVDDDAAEVPEDGTAGTAGAVAAPTLAGRVKSLLNKEPKAEVVEAVEASDADSSAKDAAPKDAAVSETAAAPAATVTKAKAEPAKVAKPEPKKVEPEKVEAAKAEPVKAVPAKAEPAKVEAAKAEPVKAEPEKVEAAKAEPVKAVPAKAEPAKAETAKVEPAKAEPAKTEPATPDDSTTRSAVVAKASKSAQTLFRRVRSRLDRSK
ncbi:prolipoprotein diacylglyceryl transferase [Antrihabitans stalagmiti]|uniref:prolipoprotein diacylglyceryl transferase n=1 Tax=Antrihabitans stalagmiti TaxID=2799499 RepID=UPI0027DB371E|nr:prolipoprotein diacylglyceryl transferase [Antrihabitans stalagmiti]